jgi:hypothetical protein
MMILASAVLAGSLLATDAQARGFRGGGHMGGFRGGHMGGSAAATVAMEDVTATALAARITRHTARRTPAPTEW